MDQIARGLIRCAVGLVQDMDRSEHIGHDGPDNRQGSEYYIGGRCQGIRQGAEGIGQGTLSSDSRQGSECAGGRYQG
ncbi:hypothetical protein AKJ16_DCAP07118 [Drosera capensis]